MKRRIDFVQTSRRVNIDRGNYPLKINIAPHQALNVAGDLNPVAILLASANGPLQWIEIER